MVRLKKTHQSDVLGITASGLCAVHCAITPVVFVAKPVLESTVHDEFHGHWWGVFDFVFLILSLIAVYFSARHSDHVIIKRSLWFSWILFAVGLTFEFFEFSFGIWIMYLGSFALIFTHIKNYRYCQKCKITLE